MTLTNRTSISRSSGQPQAEQKERGFSSPSSSLFLFLSSWVSPFPWFPSELGLKEVRSSFLELFDMSCLSKRFSFLTLWFSVFKFATSCVSSMSWLAFLSLKALEMAEPLEGSPGSGFLPLAIDEDDNDPRWLWLMGRKSWRWKSASSKTSHLIVIGRNRNHTCVSLELKLRNGIGTIDLNAILNPIWSINSEERSPHFASLWPDERRPLLQFFPPHIHPLSRWVCPFSSFNTFLLLQ